MCSTAARRVAVAAGGDGSRRKRLVEGFLSVTKDARDEVGEQRPPEG
jgi:hypothetical protein